VGTEVITMLRRGVGLFGAALAALALLGCTALADYVYVANPYIGDDSLGTVVRLRASDLSVLQTLDVGNRAHSLAVSPDGERIWVSCPGSPGSDGAIYVLSFTLAGRLEVRDVIDVGDVTPYGLAFTPNGRTVFVAFAASGQVGVFDATSYAYDTVDVGDDPTFIVITPDGRKAYAIIEQHLRVVAIRTADRRIVADIDLAGRDLQDAVISPDGERLYVANRQVRRIEVIDTAADILLAPIADPFSLDLVDSPRAVGISPDGAYLFVGSVRLTTPGGSDFAGEVKMIRLSDGTVIDAEPMPNNPRRIAVSDDGRRIYVTDHGTFECYAFDVGAGGLSLAAAEDVSTIAGADANTVGVAVGPSPLPSFGIDPCLLFPGSCHPIDPSDLGPEIMYIGPLDDFGERLIDPLEWNCLRKFVCPGCEQSKYCLWYNFIFDLSAVGLSPQTLAIELIDRKGRVLAEGLPVNGALVVSYRLSGFPEGGKGAELYFSIRLGPKGQPGVRYKLPVQLKLTKEPLAGN
jgi:DNA-binding beta-propeller fold protein YncE